ncbi:MAG: isocitrate lyase/PEP mutase family protein [Pseudomonadota bacterium]
MTATTRRERVRALLASTECFHPGSVFDPMSARIACDLGFETGMFAGSTASLTVLGAPDLIVLTLTEFADQCRRICRAADLPLLVDADHGYGNALNAARTVTELDDAGVAALTIEDTVLPQTYGNAGPRLLSIDEGVGKMRAALAGRQDPTLVVAGRTSATALSDVEDAIARCQAYEAAGVDMLMLVGVKTRAELERISAATTLPLMLGSASGELKDKPYLAGQRVRIALQGHQPIRAGVQAIHDTLKALRDGVSPDQLTGVAGADLMRRVTRQDDYDDANKEFLGL